MVALGFKRARVHSDIRQCALRHKMCACHVHQLRSLDAELRRMTGRVEQRQQHVPKAKKTHTSVNNERTEE